MLERTGLNNMPKKGIILSAGKGIKMGVLTDETPKSLIRLDDKCLLDWTLDHIKQVDLHDIVINAHRYPDQTQDFAERRRVGSNMNIHILKEPELLGTGGGVKNALSILGNDPFYVFNSDCIWINSGRPAMERLADYWDAEKMDMLILLCETHKAYFHDGKGDYFIEDSDYRLKRNHDKTKTAPTVFTGIRIMHPRLFDNTPDGPFNFVDLMDKAERNGRLFGLMHQGDWFDVGTYNSFQKMSKMLGD